MKDWNGFKTALLEFDWIKTNLSCLEWVQSSHFLSFLIKDNIIGMLFFISCACFLVAM